MNHLYMLLLGCRPAGRLTEQHDILFGIAESPAGLIDQIKTAWPEAKGKIHVDAIRSVTQVDGYRLSVTDKMRGIAGPRLFFINLGGYKENEFEEFHYKMLVVADDKAAAISKSRHTAFYKHTGIAGAPSHIDDKYGIDVDDLYEIEDILPPALRDKYSIRIEPGTGPADAIELGYITMEKLGKTCLGV